MVSKPSKYLLFFLLLVSLLATINTKCSMAQDKDQTPRPAKGDNETEPHTIHGEDSYCPELAGIKTCCTEYQINQLKSNFQALESIFGGDGGCDVCVVNLKRFWCYFTCAPNQADFLKVGKLTNYTIDGKRYELRDITYKLDDQTNCELFQSCKKTKFVAQVPSMGNAIGFTNFQGINAYTRLPVYVTMEIDNVDGVKYSNDKCNIQVPPNGTIRGYSNNKNCSCNTCAYSCNYNFEVSMSVMNGANIPLIVFCYIVVLLATVGLFFFKKKTGKDSQTSIQDDESDELNYKSGRETSKN